MNQRSLAVAHENLLHRAGLVDGKDRNGQTLIAAKCKCSRIHYFEVAHDGFIKRNIVIALRIRIDLGILRLDTVDLCRLENHFGADLRTA